MDNKHHGKQINSHFISFHFIFVKYTASKQKVVNCKKRRIFPRFGCSNVSWLWNVVEQKREKTNYTRRILLKHVNTRRENAKMDFLRR